MSLLTSKKLLSALVLPVGMALALQGSTAIAGPEVASADAHFAGYAADVAPILEQYCVRCHGGADENGEVRTELGFDLTTYEGLMTGSTYGTVIEAGDPDNSLLIEMVVAGDMPEEGDPVPPELIEVLKTWIAEGALNN